MIGVRSELFCMAAEKALAIAGARSAMATMGDGDVPKRCRLGGGVREAALCVASMCSSASLAVFAWRDNTTSFRTADHFISCPFESATYSVVWSPGK